MWTAKSGTCICWTVRRAGKSKPLDRRTSSFTEDLPGVGPPERPGRSRVYQDATIRGGDPDGRTDIDVIDATRGGAWPLRTVIRHLRAPTRRSSLGVRQGNVPLLFWPGYGTPNSNGLYAGTWLLSSLPAAGGAPRPARPTSVDRGRHFPMRSAPIRPRLSPWKMTATIYPARIDLSGGAITRRKAPRRW